MRDRAPSDATSLVDPNTGELREVEWNYEAKRFTWTYQGETYAKQYFPPMLHNQECSPEQLIAEMDYVGVDMALLHTSPHLDRLNNYLADAAKRYPSRLMWLISLPDAEIPRDPDAAIRQVERYVKAGGNGYQFFTKHYYELGNTEPWDDGAMRPFWEAVTALKVPMHFTVQVPFVQRYSADEREGYLKQQSILLRWMERYPRRDRGYDPRAAVERLYGGGPDQVPGRYLGCVQGPAAQHAPAVSHTAWWQVGIPLEAGGADGQGVRGAHRSRPPHLGNGYAHGGPVLHLSPDPGPVSGPLRVPLRRRAGGDYRRHGGAGHGRRMKVLGIETSCDETAAAVIEDGRTIHSNVVASQAELHATYGGIVPEVASRQHLLTFIPVVQQALNEADIGLPELDGIAVTHGPGLAGSLLVGVNAAKGLALAHEIPFIGVNHLEGHVYAGWLGGEDPEADPGFPLLCLIASGGHTDLVLMDGHGRFTLVGRTRDDAAGEAFDKSARVLGLGFPGGPAIQRVAATGKGQEPAFPRPRVKDSLDFSFSGLKTALLRRAEAKGWYPPGPGVAPDAKQVAEVAAAFQEAIVDSLVTRTVEAVERYRAKGVLLGGGVAANELLRTEMAERAAGTGAGPQA